MIARVRPLALARLPLIALIFGAALAVVCASSCGSSGVGGSPGSGGASGAHGDASSQGGQIGAGGSAGTRAGGAGGAPTGSDAGAGGAAGLWRPFADTSVWNTPIASGAAIDSNSSTLIADFSSISGQTQLWINIQTYSVPVYWVDSTTTAKSTVMAALGGTGFRMGAASDSVAAGSGPAPIPSGAMPAGGTDQHLAIVDRQARMEWAFWDADHSTGTWTAGEASTQDLSGSGVRPPERNNPWWAGHGPRACGFGLIAGLITVDDIQAGTINHALVIAYPHIRSSTYTPPASSAQGTTSDALPTRGILCGARIQLDPTLDLSTLSLSPAALTIARALQVYGAFVGDYSGAVSLYADASADAQASWSAGLLANDEAQKIPLNRFRVLAIGTIYNNMN
jgi:hypothetical protein